MIAHFCGIQFVYIVGTNDSSVRMASNRITFLLGTLTLITCVQAFPQTRMDEQSRQPRQDDDDDSSNPINFGAQVAQIITGAFTGNLDSIIKGSFGFIGDPTVNKLSHNTWESLKGNPTQTPPWATTTSKSVESEREPEPPAPEPTEKPTLPPAPPPTPAKEVPPSPPVTVASAEPAPAVAPLASIAPASSVVSASAPPDFVYAPDVYYPGSPHYPTRPPTRVKQPTYATLAPLAVIEGRASTEPEVKTTIRTTTEEEDDGDEAEGFSSGEIYRQ